MKKLFNLIIIFFLGFNASASAQERGNPYAVFGPEEGQVLSYPTRWMEYKPLPEMKGKRLGVISHMFVKEGMAEEAKAAFKEVVDIAIQEPTCLVLKAAQSLTDPSHLILYEEWEDYDEFFNVQLSKDYRPHIMSLLFPYASRPAAPEFFEVLHDASVAKPKTEGQYFAVIPSMRITNMANEEILKDAFVPYLDQVAQDHTSMVLNMQQSLNDPAHLLIYEEWSDLDYFLSTELHKPYRMEFIQKLSGIVEGMPVKDSRMEFFEIYYDPGKP